ncbi:hypothetical protein [Streptomyces sp. NBC_01571]|uniref:hypothetical protein n=1 Tax=Streptomyces sp. NBC_01571 TaxID=2975883 RepID=UPI00224D439B|nr:hypothetical protein [Streptomyces sp. NBC_01571]MCX4574253.1 hypothetical protein [Streptomyces sp. NBC_01571]
MRKTARRRERQQPRAKYGRFVRWSMTARGRFAWHALDTVLLAAPVLLSLWAGPR